MKKKIKLNEAAPKRSEAKGLLALGICLVFACALFSFHFGYPKANWLGLVGYYLALCIQYLFGFGSYAILLYGMWWGWRLITQEEPPKLGLNLLYFSLFLVSSCFLLNLIAEKGFLQNPLFKSHVVSESIIQKYPYRHSFTRYYLGGAPLYYLYKDVPALNLQNLLSDVGIALTFSLTATVSLLLLTQVSVIRLFLVLKNWTLAAYLLLKKFIRSLKPISVDTSSDDFSYLSIEKSLQRQSLPSLPTMQISNYARREERLIEEKPTEPKLEQDFQEDKEALKKQDVVQEEPKFVETLPTTQELVIDAGSPSAKQKKRFSFRGYKLPSPNLLTSAKKVDQPSLQRDLEKRARILEETLQSFGIEAKVGKINCGPTITSFEVHPPIGVKVQKIKVLENDIALNMQAKTIRIIAPIPGKAAVGVEVPSLIAQEVGFKETLAAYQKKSHKHHIPILLGKTVSGDDVTCDLTKMPHCIIAGATGSGKSVCINTMILSILMNKRPDEVKMLMIDPKKVELSGYSRLPHMIAPVITEATGAYAALQWLVKEMQDRYEILKLTGQRNIHAFNHRKKEAAFEQSLSREIPDKMYFIVAIIDEFADLMMASGSDLETPIARIAQMARAVGIHLVLATQRPSREVITGLIKANFPTRISFKVASRVNSQIILDENGAETLLGNGDMLFLPPGTSQLTRAQGVYVRDDDINRVVDHICRQASTDYLISSFDQLNQSEFSFGNANQEPRDELYEKAYSLVVDTGNASTTFLQRKLKIGYARAASLMDELENNGIVGPQEGSKPRRVLLGGKPGGVEETL